MLVPQELIALSRDSITCHLEGRELLLPSDSTPSQGVFVTLWTMDDQLRGCIGHIEPVHRYLVHEIADCAVLAATQDPRFPPVLNSELKDLKLEISLLQPLEKILDRSELNPKEYGVVVQKGRRKGLLLPDIDGVNTVSRQIDIACQKAGITADENPDLYRFRVTKIRE